MSTAARILNPELAAYAKELMAAGFRIYVFKDDVERVAKGGLPAGATSFRFSRMVGDRECVGSVEGRWGGYSFHMPIKPSRENGSAMFIGGIEANEWDDLTVANAELYASPTGRNNLVGLQQNHGSEGYAHLYTEIDR